MKTRIIKTGYWTSGSTLRLHKDAKYLQLYLLTSSHVGLCGIFELPDAIISMETGFSESELNLAKSALEKANKVFFYDDWVWIINHDKHNPYYQSPKTAMAYKREFSFIPKKIKDYYAKKALMLDTTIDTTIDSSIPTTSNNNNHSTMDSTPNKETINNKSETIKVGYRDFLENRKKLGL